MLLLNIFLRYNTRCPACPPARLPGKRRGLEYFIPALPQISISASRPTRLPPLVHLPPMDMDMDIGSPGPSNARRKRYGLSCLTCRRRKVRCDGTKPVCGSCSRADEQCTYSLHDPSAARLLSRLDRSEARVAELEEALRSAPQGRRRASATTASGLSAKNIERADISLDVNGEVRRVLERSSRRRTPSPDDLTTQGSTTAPPHDFMWVGAQRQEPFAKAAIPW